MKKNAIRVPLESLLYLNDRQRHERSGEHLSEKHIAHLKKEMERPHNKKGYMLMDGDMGGAIGKPENSYEEGRWTSWSVSEMKEMLDKQKLQYIDEEPQEVTNLYF